VIELRILGPLALQVNGEPVPLGPSQRILLLALLLARGPVDSARLADLVWDGVIPKGGAATLRSHVYHLRRALAGGAHQNEVHETLTTERLGWGFAYALQIPQERVDAARFERLVREGRGALSASLLGTASMLLTEALALWRGQPLADVADKPFAMAEVHRLQEMHRAATLARIEADVHLGLHHEVIGELEAMHQCWPEDDVLRRLLVTCLHRAGRVAEAARVCREGIELMLEEGLDVNSLQSLQRMILGLPLPPNLPGKGQQETAEP